MLDKSEMIFGVRAVIEAIQAGKEIDKILVKKDIQSELSKELFAALNWTSGKGRRCAFPAPRFGLRIDVVYARGAQES